MNPQLEYLVDLQKIDTETAELKALQAAIPGQIESGRSAVEEKTKKLATAQGEIKTLKDKRKKMESDVQAENDHMAKAKTKLPAVKTNKEYQALLSEIDIIKDKVSKIEDEELEIMETLEEREKTLPAFQALINEEEARFQQYKKQKEVESARIQKEIEEALVRREKVIASLEAKWVQSYEKVSKARDGVAVVPLDGNICQGCFQQVLPQMMIDIKNGSEVMHQCQHCSRVLYWIEEPSPEAAPSS